MAPQGLYTPEFIWRTTVGAPERRSFMTLLAELAAVSRRVSETASRRAKIAELAACLRGLAPDEVPIAIAFLSGETRQGRLGVAYAALRAGDWGAPPSGPSLHVEEVDAAFAGLAA